MAKQEIKLIANNKKAHHDYFLEEKYEAGVELHGTEVKSLRMGKCSIKEAFVRIEKGEVIIYGMHILLGDILSLVVEFFTFCKSDLYFHKASLEINFHRDKRIALLCNLADKFADL